MLIILTFDIPSVIKKPWVACFLSLHFSTIFVSNCSKALALSFFFFLIT